MSRQSPHADPDILPEGAIIEYVPQGAYVKVSAADPRTLEEVSIVGDPAAGTDTLARIVVRKLERVVLRKFGPVRMRRRRGAWGGASGGAPRRPDEPPSGWDL